LWCNSEHGLRPEGLNRNRIPAASLIQLFKRGAKGRRTPMPTAQEYRQKAKQCLDLAKGAKDLYAKEAMVELADEFSAAAELLEHPARKS
jgi:hypothetical protein